MSVTSRVCALIMATLTVVTGSGCLHTVGYGAGTTSAGVHEATVTKVVDGDTIHVAMNGRREKVRLIGMDTPEDTRRIEPFGSEATDYTKAALAGGRVWIETDVELRDRYGRLLAYVWLDPPDARVRADPGSHMLNAMLLEEGYAQVSTFPPNVRYVDDFVQLQRSARDDRRGLWAH